MSQPLLINIGFSLSEPIQSLILKTSQEIRDEYDSDWYVDNKKYHLHFPLYLIPIPLESKSSLESVSDEYLKICKKQYVEIEDLFYNSNGLIMIKFHLTNQLRELHKLSLEYFNPIRGELKREKYLDQSYISKLSDKDKAYVQKYGSEYVLDNYIPHVTIARIKEVGYRDEVINRYREVLVNSDGVLDRLQVHTAIYSDNKDEDRTILLFDKEIGSNTLKKK